MSQREEFVASIWQDILEIKHQWMSGYESKKNGSMSASQCYVMRFVSENQQTNVTSIAKALHITSSAATQLIDSLVQKGFILRETNPSDRRHVLLTMSPEAKNLFAQIKKDRMEKMQKLFESFSDDELKTYAQLSKKISKNLKTN